MKLSDLTFYTWLIYENLFRSEPSNRSSDLVMQEFLLCRLKNRLLINKSSNQWINLVNSVFSIVHTVVMNPQF